ncbi:MAG: hypothetical protein SGJ04_02010 [Bacteroidota bacterium]|nr:hypothetical protein [Bacteroidota bacterium]
MALAENKQNEALNIESFHPISIEVFLPVWHSFFKKVDAYSLVTAKNIFVPEVNDRGEVVIRSSHETLNAQLERNKRQLIETFINLNIPVPKIFIIFDESLTDRKVEGMPLTDGELIQKLLDEDEVFRDLFNRLGLKPSS